MEIALHIGAHRSATTSFQRYMESNAHVLNRHGIRFWGPARTRRGLFDGLNLPSGSLGARGRRRRGVGRVQLQCAMQERARVRQVIVSEENMIGTVRDNLRHERLYPAIGEQMARYAEAFAPHLTRIVLSIRSLEAYWASALGFSILRGGRVPDAAQLDRLVTQPRSWRDVIMDLSCAAPDIEILVIPFEQMAGRPDRMLEYMAHSPMRAPKASADAWFNRGPDMDKLREALHLRGEDISTFTAGAGKWDPFDMTHRIALRETYEDDLFWLRAGADGMALLVEENGTVMTGQQLSHGPKRRGQAYDQERGMVQAR